MFRMALLLLEDNNCTKLFWNPCIKYHKMYQLWPEQAQFMIILTFIWPLWPWPSTFLKKCFKWHFPSSSNNCAKLFWNPCINVQVMAWTSSMYDHLDLYLTPVTLTFNLPKQCFKWHFSSSRATTVPNCFEIHALLYRIWSWQIQTDTRMQAYTQNKNCNNYVLLTRMWTQ